jgi:hypothetical protein
MTDVGELLEVIGAKVTLLCIVTTPWPDGMEVFLASLLDHVKEASTRIWLAGPQVATLSERALRGRKIQTFRDLRELRPLLG